MRNIAIIGAGQAGLQLAIGLRKYNYRVTLFSNRTAEQIKNGRIMSSQGMFHSSLALERKLGIDFWKEIAPQNKFVSLAVLSTDNPKNVFPKIRWIGKTKDLYQSIDQRVKFSRWMSEFELLGGKLIIDDVDIKKLDHISKSNDLTVVASGKGKLSELFTKDVKRSTFDTPQRTLACIYVKNVIPSEHQGVEANIVPGIGEFFIMPGLTHSGDCQMMLFEGIPGGPFDAFRRTVNIYEQFDIALRLLKQFVPWIYERLIEASLTDENGSLIGCYIPTVNKPILELPSGNIAFGLGDAVVLNDPIAGQGANNAAKAADIYLNTIINNGSKKFNRRWMQQTFNLYWNSTAKWSTCWSNLLLSPPKPHMIRLLESAARIPELANLLANAFDAPSTLFPWITNSVLTEKLINRMNISQSAIIKQDKPVSLINGDTSCITI